MLAKITSNMQLRFYWHFIVLLKKRQKQQTKQTNKNTPYTGPSIFPPNQSQEASPLSIREQLKFPLWVNTLDLDSIDYCEAVLPFQSTLKVLGCWMKMQWSFGAGLSVVWAASTVSVAAGKSPTSLLVCVCLVRDWVTGCHCPSCF